MNQFDERVDYEEFYQGTYTEIYKIGEEEESEGVYGYRNGIAYDQVVCLCIPRNGVVPKTVVIEEYDEYLGEYVQTTRDVIGIDAANLTRYFGREQPKHLEIHEDITFIHFNLQDPYSDGEYSGTKLASIHVHPDNSYYRSVDDILLCSKDGKILYYCAPEICLQKIEIPGSIETIGPAAFSYNKAQAITGFNNVKNIGEYAFAKCNSKHIDLKKASITILPNSAFFECPYLDELSIPQTVKKIEESVFTYASIKILKIFSEEIDFVLQDWEETPTAFQQSQINTLCLEATPANFYQSLVYANIDTCQIGQKVNEIPSEYFAWNNDDLPQFKSVVFEEGSNELIIGERAFAQQTALMELHTSREQVEIKEEAFYKCDKLRYIYVHSGNFKIQSSGIFADCPLERVYVDNVDDWVLCQFDSEYCNPAYPNKFAIRDGDNYITDNISLTINASTIYPYVFAGCDGLEALKLTSAKEILTGAFTQCSNLSSIVLPHTLSNIEWYAFDYCMHLVEIFNNSSLYIEQGSDKNGGVAQHAAKIKKGEGSTIVKCNGYAFLEDEGRFLLFNQLEYNNIALLPQIISNGTDVLSRSYAIHGYAFYDKHITKAYIPMAVHLIDEYAFPSTLEEVHFERTRWEREGTIYNWNDPELAAQELMEYQGSPLEVLTSDNMLLTFTKDSENNWGVEGIGEFSGEHLEIPRYTPFGDLVTFISDDAFLNADKIKSVTLPVSIVKIGDRAFSGTNISSIDLPKNLKTIGSYAFWNTKIDSIVLPKGLQSIGDEAFGCDPFIDQEVPLFEVWIDSAFQDVSWDYRPFGSRSLRIHLDSLNTWLGLESYSLLYIGSLELYINELPVIDLIIPHEISTIPHDCFSDINHLRSVTIGNHVKTIGGEAFSQCKNLKEVYINDYSRITRGELEIVDNSFNGCSNVTFYCKNSKYNSSVDLYGATSSQAIFVDDIASDTDYLGFTFDGIHSLYDMGVYRTCEADGQNIPLTGVMQDITADATGVDGRYYFGSQKKEKSFSITFAFDDMTEEQLQNWHRFVANKELCDLIFDETPYKVYTAKITGSPTLKAICFDELDREGTKTRIYKGTGTIEFTAYYPYAHTPGEDTKVAYPFTDDGPKTFGKDGRILESYDIHYYPTKSQWSQASRICPQYAPGCNFGDLPAPFILSKSGTTNANTTFTITNKIYIKTLTTVYDLKWDSKTGIVSGLSSPSAGESTRAPVPVEGNTVGSIPVGGCRPEINGATLTYHYWYY